MAARKGDHLRARDSTPHCFCQVIGSGFVILPVQDEGWHVDLVQPVHTVIVSRCLKLPDGSIIRMRASYHRYFELEGEQATRPGHRSPFQALHDCRNEDHAFDPAWMLARNGCGNEPSHASTRHMR